MTIGSGIRLTLEEAACPVCGCREGQPTLEGYDIEFRTCDNKFTFLRCIGCGHLFLSPRPRHDEMHVIYSNYLTSNRDSAYYPSSTVAWVKDRIFDARRMRNVVRRLEAGARVLDIGAGSGRLLRLFRQLTGSQTRLYANDLFFDDVTRDALVRDNISTMEGAIERHETDVQFDAITGIHVIEHVLDPRAVFTWASAHMPPGGVLYLETPDADALCGRIFGSRWGMTHFPRHINLFTKRHLARIAVDAGFDVVHHGNITSAPAWNMSIRNYLEMDALKKHDSWFEIFNYSNVFTLGAWTFLDLLLILGGVATSTQQLVAIRR